MRSATRHEAYRADITYGTNNEFGFDYLRDNMVTNLNERVQRDLAYAIVDEVDNILVDEARTPLIISGSADMSQRDYVRYARVAPTLRIEQDYTIDEKHRTVALTQDGISKLERTLNISNLYGPENFGVVHHMENALKAQIIFQRDRDYVVQDRQVVIVDEFTGRLMVGRRYSDGLHQAIEAKEGVKIRPESITYATITLQNYFRLYAKLSGMTGTAATEAEEFDKIYKLDVVSIPTNRPMVRDDTGDLVYRDQKAKYRAVVVEIERRHIAGQPVLVGTTDIDKSEVLSAMLQRKGVPHEVLNAKQHEREASIVAQAGKPGAVTVATNMAGRGTDIVLGGSAEINGSGSRQWETDHRRVLDVGGLHIIGTERHEARRIDNQLRGRAGRQGDPGTTQFYVALDDELVRRFGGDRIRSVMDWAGLDEDVPIDNGMINKSIENAQVKVEAFHFDMRKHLVEFDDVVNTHREVIYGERDKILSGADLKGNIQKMLADQIGEIVAGTLGDSRPSDWDIDSFLAEVGTVIPPPEEFFDDDYLVGMDVDAVESSLLEHAERTYDEMEAALTPEVMRDLERHLLLRSIDTNWVQHLTTMENLRQGIGLHAYGQRDPLVMYRKEGMDQFQLLEQKIQSDVAHSIFRVQITMGQSFANGSRSRRQRPAPQPIRAAAPSAKGGRKVGRNQPCPCGSGKKYKRCCAA
jgi:preprotein translocase subunit SecA